MRGPSGMRRKTNSPKVLQSLPAQDSYYSKCQSRRSMSSVGIFAICARPGARTSSIWRLSCAWTPDGVASDDRRQGGAHQGGHQWVTVGTIIADRPPYRSVRAELPHTAPTLDEWRQNERRDRDAGHGQAIAIVRRSGEYGANWGGCADCYGPT